MCNLRNDNFTAINDKLTAKLAALGPAKWLQRKEDIGPLVDVLINALTEAINETVPLC